MEIQLTRGMTMLLDECDNELLQGHKVQAVKCKNKFYASMYLNGKSIQIHRLLMNASKGVQVDHINGNPLDNRRNNLRLCTNYQNAWNVGKTKRNKSGFKGVSWQSRDKRWRAQICVNKKYISLGFYGTPEEAHKAYVQGSLKYHGDFSKF
jgi:hypothetical protein